MSESDFVLKTDGETPICFYHEKSDCLFFVITLKEKEPVALSPVLERPRLYQD